VKKEYVAWIFSHAFQDSFLIEILIPGERFRVPGCHLTKRNVGYDP
jgi:hypothetical protein